MTRFAVEHIPTIPVGVKERTCHGRGIVCHVVIGIIVTDIRKTRGNARGEETKQGVYLLFDELLAAAGVVMADTGQPQV